jgi:hypothetical protein
MTWLTFGTTAFGVGANWEGTGVVCGAGVFFLPTRFREGGGEVDTISAATSKSWTTGLDGRRVGPLRFDTVLLLGAPTFVAGAARLIFLRLGIGLGRLPAATFDSATIDSGSTTCEFFRGRGFGEEAPAFTARFFDLGESDFRENAFLARRGLDTGLAVFADRDFLGFIKHSLSGDAGG